MTTCLSRFEGRLFAEGGCLFLVVRVDEENGTGRVSCRIDGEHQIIDMPLADITKRVAKGAGLILDNLNGPQAAKRLRQRKDGWYFTTREGEKGSYASRQIAAQELARYILSMQSLHESRRQPLRSEARRPSRTGVPEPA
ncbi:MAG: DUF6316 family protein [Gammaproteobacteria bacterium]|nr:DUF6316 family protein [Gammaproteobacteria bacterium]